MKIYKIIKGLLVVGVISIVSCTKLDEKLNSTLSNTETANALGPNGVSLLLQKAYNDLKIPFTAQDGVFSLQENSTDESLVPTRGGDWDDNGVWRVIHAHTWNADHSQVLANFNNLNKINFDATNVLGFSPSAAQAAQAKVIRAFALYTLLDLYGQFPVRNPGDNLLNAPNVLSGTEAVTFIQNDLTAAISALPATGTKDVVTKDVGNVLLMKLLLNKGMFISRAAPTFADADMQQIITLGNAIISSAKYSYAANYFDNFSSSNTTASESIWAIPYTSGIADADGPYGGPIARWMMTEHYNSDSNFYGNAGWNGFSTVGDFYNSFGVAAPTTATNASNRVSGFFTGVGATNNPDVLLDSRLGGKSYPTITPFNGIRPGFLIGQQTGKGGGALKDRKGNPLAFDPQIAADMKETGANLEITGIRVVKYVPDYTSNGKFYGNPGASNSIQLFRYPDVVLMVAEAKLRAAAPDATGALALVNGLRAARAAAPMVAPLTLLDAGTYANISSSVDNPKCLLAERGRELYWEAQRRTDLLRFGQFTKVWQYKPTDDAHYAVYPIPNQALASNPNLKQNPGY